MTMSPSYYLVRDTGGVPTVRLNVAKKIVEETAEVKAFLNLLQNLLGATERGNSGLSSRDAYMWLGFQKFRGEI